MKILLLSFVLLIPFLSTAQDSDTTLGKWIQVSSIEFNHTHDTWIREPSKSLRTGPLYIHDTIYIDSLKIGLMNHVISLLGRFEKPKPKPPESIQINTDFFTKMSIGWRGSHKIIKKKHKNTLDDYGGDEHAYASQCPLDTVRGTLLYNSATAIGENGNLDDKGMWVGCYPPYLYNNEFFMIPGKYLHHIQDKYGKTKTVGSYIGRFYTQKNKSISNWRVYGLVIKYNIINLDSTTKTFQLIK